MWMWNKGGMAISLSQHDPSLLYGRLGISSRFRGGESSTRGGESSTRESESSTRGGKDWEMNNGDVGRWEETGCSGRW